MRQLFEDLSQCVFIFQQSMAAVGSSDHVFDSNIIIDKIAKKRDFLKIIDL